MLLPRKAEVNGALTPLDFRHRWCHWGALCHPNPCSFEQDQFYSSREMFGVFSLFTVSEISECCGSFPIHRKISWYYFFAKSFPFIFFILSSWNPEYVHTGPLGTILESSCHFLLIGNLCLFVHLLKDVHTLPAKCSFLPLLYWLSKNSYLFSLTTSALKHPDSD